MKCEVGTTAARWAIRILQYCNTTLLPYSNVCSGPASLAVSSGWERSVLATRVAYMGCACAASERFCLGTLATPRSLASISAQLLLAVRVLPATVGFECSKPTPQPIPFPPAAGTSSSQASHASGPESAPERSRPGRQLLPAARKLPCGRQPACQAPFPRGIPTGGWAAAWGRQRRAGEAAGTSWTPRRTALPGLG